MKPRLRELTLLLALAPALTAPAAAAPCVRENYSPIIAAQIHVLGGATWEEAGLELDRLQEAGFNAVFFRAFQNFGDRYHGLATTPREEEIAGVYYQSALAPTVADILPRLAEMCRARGIRFYAWMVTRRMDWLDKKEWRDIRYDLASGETVTESHFDLFNSDFADYLLRMFEELAALPIDGIVIQDDFTIKTYEGFTPAALESFRLENGFAARPQDLFAETFTGADGRLHSRNHGDRYLLWCTHKAERLQQLGGALAARCRRVGVNLELILNVYYDAVLNPEEALCWLGQDLDLLASSPFDRLCLMAYHRQIAEEQKLGVSEAIALTHDLVAELYSRFGDRLIVKLQAADWRNREPIGVVEMKQLLEAVGPGANNWALAPVEPDGEAAMEAARLIVIHIAEKRGSEGR
jgi:hypothetical protein